MRPIIGIILLTLACGRESSDVATDALFMTIAVDASALGTTVSASLQKREGLGAQKLRLEDDAYFELTTPSESTSLNWDVYSRSYTAELSEDLATAALQLSLIRPEFESVPDMEIQLRSAPEIDGLTEGEELALSQWELDLGWSMDTVDEELSGSDAIHLWVQADMDEDGTFDSAEDITLYSADPIDLGSESLVLTQWTTDAHVSGPTACRLTLSRPSVGSVGAGLAGGSLTGSVRRSVEFVFSP